MIQALRNNIIVRPIYEENKSSIIIPKSATIWKQYEGEVFGEVMSIGKDYKYDLKIGDIVTFQRHEGVRIWYERVMYLKLKEKWVHGKIINDK